MTHESRHLSVFVARPQQEVYAFVADPANLPRWAPGLGTEAHRVDDAWFVETPHGRVQVTFAPHNDLGVLDHRVVTPTGEVVDVPLRVLAVGDQSEVVFTLRRGAGMTDDELDRDEQLVTADLARLKQIMEAGPA